MEYSDDLKLKVITYLRKCGKDNPDIDEVVDQFSELFDKMRQGEKLPPIYAVAVYNVLDIVQEQTTLEIVSDNGEVD
jgi:Fe2+ or Zn2+ uptake regulation protein